MERIAETKAPLPRKWNVAWLLDRCVAWAKAHPHPDLRDKTIWEVLESERPSLVPYVGPFDGFHAVPASVSKTCLVRFDTNRYSVDARAVARASRVSSRRCFPPLFHLFGTRPRWST